MLLTTPFPSLFSRWAGKLPKYQDVALNVFGKLGAFQSHQGTRRIKILT